MQTGGAKGKGSPTATSLPTAGQDKPDVPVKPSAGARLPRETGKYQESKPKHPQLTERTVADINLGRPVTDWFEVEINRSPEMLAEVRKSQAQADKKLEELTSKKSSKKKKQRPPSRTTLAADQRQQRCRLNMTTGYNLLRCGLAGEARPYLHNARMDMTPQTDAELAAAIHYAWFTLHHLSGENAEAMGSLRQCMDYDNMTANWEMMLVRMGMVDEYRSFSNPGQAWEILRSIKATLARNRSRGNLEEASLYTKQLAIEEIIEKTWAIFLPVVEQARNFPMALSRVHDYLGAVSKIQSRESLQEALETHRYIAGFISGKMSVPLANFHQQRGSRGLEEISSQWQKMQSLILKFVALRQPVDLKPIADEFIAKGMPESEADQFFKGMLDIDQYAAVAAFMELPRELQANILELAAMVHTKSRESTKPPMTCNLRQLHEDSIENHRADALFSAMSQSASQVYWVRDCLRHLAGIDMAKDIQTAMINAECVKRINEASGAYLKALCLLQMQKIRLFEEQLKLAAIEHQHPPALLALGDRYRYRSGSSDEGQPNETLALKYYLQAGEAGAAAGYIKAAELVTLQAEKQNALWNVASAYYQQAYQLLSRWGLTADEQHCVAMAEFCESMLEVPFKQQADETVATVDEASPGESTEIQPESVESTEKLQTEPELPVQKAPVEASPVKSKATQLASDTQTTPTKVSKATRRTQSTYSLARDFWRQMITANMHIRELDLASAEEDLDDLQRQFGQSIYSARIDQARAWCCKTMIDHMDLVNSEESCRELITRGWQHVAAGILKLTGKHITRQNLDRQDFDTRRLSREARRSLASLVSTAAHLSSLETNIHRSKTLRERTRHFYHEADTINPGRMRQQVETWQSTGRSVQVIDEETFEIMKNAMKDLDN